MKYRSHQKSAAEIDAFEQKYACATTPAIKNTLSNSQQNFVR